ncbi:hypothetical protein, partial [Akkermansia sp.]|uniref:hypothetical protein n=1 Tax=Akkermansia sp. TaxID=1872421 RepID=UPI003AB339A2
MNNIHCYSFFRSFIQTSNVWMNDNINFSAPIASAFDSFLRFYFTGSFPSRRCPPATPAPAVTNNKLHKEKLVNLKTASLTATFNLCGWRPPSGKPS